MESHSTMCTVREVNDVEYYDFFETKHVYVGEH